MRSDPVTVRQCKPGAAFVVQCPTCERLVHMHYVGTRAPTRVICHGGNAPGLASINGSHVIEWEAAAYD